MYINPIFIMIYNKNKLDGVAFVILECIIIALSVVSCNSDITTAGNNNDILCNTRQYLIVKFDGDNHYTMLNSKGEALYGIPAGKNKSSIPSQVLDDYFWFENKRYNAATGGEISIPEDYSIYVYGLTRCDLFNADMPDLKRHVIVNRDKQELCSKYAVYHYDPFYIYCYDPLTSGNHNQYLFSLEGDSLLSYDFERDRDLYMPSDEGLWCLSFVDTEKSNKRIFVYYTSDGQEKYKIPVNLQSFNFIDCPMIDGQVVIDGSIYDKNGNVVYAQLDKDSLRAEYPLGDGLFLASKVKGLHVFYGVMDCDGHEIIPCRYVRFVHNTCGKNGITPSFRFNIMRLGEYFVFMNSEGKWVLVDKNGREKEMPKSIVEIAKLDETGFGENIFGPLCYRKMDGDTPSCVLEGEFKSYDLLSYALRGQVKTCGDMTFDKWGRITGLGEGLKINYNGISVTSGEIISYGVTEEFSPHKMPLRRKSVNNPNIYNGAIDEISFGGMEGYKFEYYENGLISSYTHWTGDLKETIDIEYNDRGFPLIERCTQNSFEGNYSWLTKYKYKEVDSHGNWISRTVSIEDFDGTVTDTSEEKRAITYYE